MNPASLTVLLLLGAAALGQDSYFLPLGSGPSTVSTVWPPTCFGPSADYDGDGNTDVLVAFPLELRCRLGDGQGGFTTEVISPTPIACNLISPWPLYEKALDLDLDGDLDLVLATPCGIQSLLNDGTGFFTPTVIVPGTQGVQTAEGIGVGDLNNDGLPDVTMTDTQSAFMGISISLNVQGVFVPGPSIPLPAIYSPIEIGDVNGDGFDDIVASPAVGSIPVSQNILRVFINDAIPGVLSFSTEFTTPVTTPILGPGVGIMHMADVTGDGMEDYVLAPFVPNGTTPTFQFAVYPGTLAGFGTPLVGPVAFVLGPPPPFNWALRAYPFHIADVNLDGIQDITCLCYETALITSQWFAVAVFHGLGNGEFAQALMTRLNIPIPFPRGYLTVADLDNDSDLDLVYGDWDVPTNTLTLRPMISEIITARGVPGTFGIPTFPVGPCAFGSTSFFAGLGNALPATTAILGVSLAPRPPLSPLAFGISLSTLDLIWPTQNFGVFQTDANGSVTLPFTLPAMWSYPNESVGFYGQWAVEDPTGLAAFGTTSLALTPARKVVIY